MEKKPQTKLAPKVKTLFHFSKTTKGNAVAPSNTTTIITTVSGPSGYIS